ncbi:zinc finger SWIM domain-containing protein [Burkholderia plantarii]|uniref:Putative zinc finger, SWIM domain protein n=2 Tax=Burkholderia plantarii TaxID=41899 RepID=A0A0B6S533_BURPL|nr:putative zinc finger, SWIM domain protein [Burkholderia plantarii]ALK32624.1 zinc finger SWIM domain-containing protein [Burkholderia plantarii]
MMSPTLADVLTLAAVLELADEKTVARGHACFHEGAVSRLDVDVDRLRATVRGGALYTVELRAGAGRELIHACSCPVGERRQFCKHAVAVALSWLENSGAEVFPVPDVPAKAARKPRKTQADWIDEFLATLDVQALRDWLREAAASDRALRDKLLLAARASGGDKADLKAAVRRIARVSRHLDWREASGYAAGLETLAGSLRERLDGARAGQVVELAELAIELAVASLERVDDSGGAVLPAIRELAAVHLDACLRTRPEPVSLARRLFGLQLIDDWTILGDVLPAYAPALGTDGLQRYREQLDARWDALPALDIGADRRQSYEDDRLRIEAAKLALARFDDDADALIAALAKDLSSGYRFLQVAEACVEYGRDDEALAWARRGIAAGGSHPDTRLHAFCIALHLRNQDFADADACAWQRFLCRPSADAFAALMQVAATTGSTEATRTRALAHLRACIERDASARDDVGTIRRTAYRGELVKALLMGDDAEAAWRVFNEGTVPTEVWRAMAEARGRAHPHDAIALYHRLLPAEIERGTYGARYEPAFEIVKAIAGLRRRHGEHDEFAAELETIRTTHRAKRNFVKLLDSLS